MREAVTVIPVDPGHLAVVEDAVHLHVVPVGHALHVNSSCHWHCAWESSQHQPASDHQTYCSDNTCRLSRTATISYFPETNDHRASTCSLDRLVLPKHPQDGHNPSQPIHTGACPTWCCL